MIYVDILKCVCPPWTGDRSVICEVREAFPLEPSCPNLVPWRKLVIPYIHLVRQTRDGNIAWSFQGHCRVSKKSIQLTADSSVFYYSSSNNCSPKIAKLSERHHISKILLGKVLPNEVTPKPPLGKNTRGPRGWTIAHADYKLNMIFEHMTKFTAKEVFSEFVWRKKKVDRMPFIALRKRCLKAIMSNSPLAKLTEHHHAVTSFGTIDGMPSCRNRI